MADADCHYAAQHFVLHVTIARREAGAWTPVELNSCSDIPYRDHPVKCPVEALCFWHR